LRYYYCAFNINVECNFFPNYYYACHASPPQLKFRVRSATGMVDNTAYLSKMLHTSVPSILHPISFFPRTYPISHLSVLPLLLD
jgi:hypothetical protein